MKIRKISRSIVFFLLVQPFIVPSQAQTPPADVALLRRIGEQYIRETLRDANDLNQLAEQVGLTTDELKQVCRMLGIDISRLVQREIMELASYQGFTSADMAPTAVLANLGGSDYILFVEKSSHKLFVLRYANGQASVANVYDCKTGKESGDKMTEGDNKTPEGMYFLTTMYDRNHITSLVGKGNAYEYGDMAFVTDYPNLFDVMHGKNGNGIWLHGTDEEFFETSSLDTRGCVVTTNETIDMLQPLISLRETPLIICETIGFDTRANHDTDSREILDLVEGWRGAWAEQRLNDYLSYYDDTFRSSGRDKTQWGEYKTSIFDRYNINHILLDNLIALKYGEGVIVVFNQDYDASNLGSVNRKALHFIRRGDTWKIIAETIWD